jgi:hypothetical protein
MEGTVRGDAQGTFGSYSLTGVGQYWDQQPRLGGRRYGVWRKRPGKG